MAGAHQLWQEYGSVPMLLSSYLDPLLAVPVILSIIYLVFRFIPAFRGYVVVTWGKALVLALALSVFFEIFAPRLKTGFYADVWDVVAYFAGAVLFVWVFGEDGRRVAEAKTWDADDAD